MNWWSNALFQIEASLLFFISILFGGTSLSSHLYFLGRPRHSPCQIVFLLPCLQYYCPVWLSLIWPPAPACFLMVENPKISEAMNQHEANVWFTLLKHVTQSKMVTPAAKILTTHLNGRYQPKTVMKYTVVSCGGSHLLQFTFHPHSHHSYYCQWIYQSYLSCVFSLSPGKNKNLTVGSIIYRFCVELCMLQSRCSG